MEFNKFVKMWLDTSEGSLSRMSKYKHENEQEYQEYRARVKATEEFYRQNRSRSLKEGKAYPELTEKNFFEFDKSAQALNALTGRH